MLHPVNEDEQNSRLDQTHICLIGADAKHHESIKNLAAQIGFHTPKLATREEGRALGAHPVLSGIAQNIAAAPDGFDIVLALCCGCEFLA